MFYHARLRLTFLYSAIFLILFWSLSFGIYFWMNRYLGDDRMGSAIHIDHARSLISDNMPLNEPLSDIIMDDLKNILIVLDASLLLIIPIITWYLTGATLRPVQESHEKERRFFTDASHDLRTPLTILKGEIDLALKKNQTVEEYKHILNSGKDEVARLIELVENMLFLSREHASLDALSKESLDLTDILTEMVSKFQNMAYEKHLTLIFTPSSQAIVMLGNKQLLQRLIIILLDNAIKYTPGKGHISVTLIQKKQHIYIAIRDTGIGISEEHQEKVFDRFYRADSARSEKGYGLGLSIAKQIAAFHNGTISLKSKEGQGTTITISFPLSTQNQGRSQS